MVTLPLKCCPCTMLFRLPFPLVHRVGTRTHPSILTIFEQFRLGNPQFDQMMFLNDAHVIQGGRFIVT